MLYDAGIYLGLCPKASICIHLEEIINAMLTELQNRKLLKLFCMYDGDQNQFLVKKDFEKIAIKIAEVKNIGSRSPKLMGLKERYARVWKSLSSKADDSGDKKVCLSEWLAYYEEILGDKEKYQEEVQALMKLIFEVFDDNGDGQISQQEWTELFQVYNIHPAYAPDSFKKLDTNGDGVISREEILSLIDDFFCGNDVNAVANSMFGPY